MVATLLFAGLRIGELLPLRRGDVDLARDQIRVRQGKTDAGARKVAIPAVLRDELVAYRASLRGVDRSAYMFPTSTGAVGTTNSGGGCSRRRSRWRTRRWTSGRRGRCLN